MGTWKRASPKKVTIGSTPTAIPEPKINQPPKLRPRSHHHNDASATTLTATNQTLALV